jgi:hypothetical protein
LGYFGSVTPSWRNHCQTVLRDNPAGYLYREATDREGDSGWRITANNESDEYMDDAANGAYVSLGAVLNRDDAFMALLDSPEGSAFVRDPDKGVFMPSEE